MATANYRTPKSELRLDACFEHPPDIRPLPGVKGQIVDTFQQQPRLNQTSPQRVLRELPIACLSACALGEHEIVGFEAESNR